MGVKGAVGRMNTRSKGLRSNTEAMCTITKEESCLYGLFDMGGVDGTS